MPEELPKGWVKTTLGAVIEPARARALPSEAPELPYVGMEHIEAQTMMLLGQGSARSLKSSSVRFKQGDVLYGKMRPYLNKVWLAEFDGLCSAEFLVFPKTVGLNAQFFAYRLNSQDFVNFANHRASGDRPRVDFKKLRAFPYLLPPCCEQDRIVAKLNALLSRVASGEAAARRSLERLKRYRAAVLHAAVTGELTRDWRKTHHSVETGAQLHKRLLAERRTRWEEVELKRLQSIGKPPRDNCWKDRYRAPFEADPTDLAGVPEGWAWASVDEIAAHEPRAITDGPFGSHLKSSHYTRSGPRVIRLKNIGDGVFIDEMAHISQKHYEFLEDHAIFEGDLVVRALGIPAPRACKIPEGIGPAIVKADCIRLKVASDFALADYVLLALNAPSTQHRTEKKIHGVGRPRLNLGEIKSIAIPFPSVAEQSEIVREVERRLAEAERLTTTLNRQLDRAQATRQSLLREAFAGMLVPQDPKDEPASVLLDRISLAREAEAKKPKLKRMPKAKLTFATWKLFDLIKDKFGGKAFTFEALRENIDTTEHEYEDLRAELYEMLRPDTPSAAPVLQMTFDAKKEAMEFKLTKP